MINNGHGLTQDRLRHLLNYDAETGLFTHRTSRKHNAKAGDIAGWSNAEGYWLARIDGKYYRLHRLAWLYTYGEWPKGEIDHINGIPSDNRITNLREATRSQNCQNAVSRQGSTSKHLGVCWHKDMRKWRAAITVNGARTHLGYFSDEDEAGAAYIAAKKTIHEFHAEARVAQEGE